MTPAPELQRYSVESLREFSTRIFLHCGLTEGDAAQAADVLVTADLWNIDTHGVARLRHYYEMLARGYVNPRANIRIVRELPGTANVDGDNGLGLVVGPKANEMAMEKAESVGSGWVTVFNSHHFGIAGYYPYVALQRNLIAWAMTNTTPQVAPLWGAEKMLGTNPIAIAFPGHDEAPVVIDMATSSIAYGVVENAIRKHEQMPAGLIVDHEGVATTNPRDMANGGAILPLGMDHEHGGHKGYCLAAMIDVLCGVLSGANWGPFVPPFPYYLKPAEGKVGKGIGHLFGAFRIDGFIEPEEFKRRLDEWVRTLRATKPARGTDGPIIPGDPEREAQAINSRDGVKLHPSVVQELNELSKTVGVPFD